MRYIQHSFAAVFGLLLVSMLVGGCGRDQSSHDDIPPSAPRWIDRYDDTAWGQQGIRAEPVTNPTDHWVRIEWYANPESDVITYRVWRTPEVDPTHPQLIKDLRLGVDLAEGQSRYSWVDHGDNPLDRTRDNLAPDVNTGESRGYYWSMQALDSAGNQSPFSLSIYYRLLANPSMLSVTANGDSAHTYTLSYVYSPSSQSDVTLYDMIRVYPSTYGPDSVVLAEQHNLYGDFRTVSLNFSRPMTPGGTYVCQVNSICNRRNEAHADSLAGDAAFTTFVYH